MPGRDNALGQDTHRMDLSIHLAHISKAHILVAYQLPLKLRVAHKGTFPLLFYQIPLGAQLIHSPPHRDAAYTVQLTQFRLRRNLLLRLISALLDGTLDVFHQLLVERRQRFFNQSQAYLLQ